MSASADAVTLEGSYRRLLKLFPPSYRATREEELLTVLMDGARPGQTRPTTGETVDLLRSAGRHWMAFAFGSDRAVRRDAAAAMALLLPVLLLYPVGKIARLGILFAPQHYLRIYLGFTPDWPSWLLWGLVNLLLLARLSRPARWIAPLAMGLGLFAWWRQLMLGGPTMFVHASGWLLVQVVALVLLLAPARVERGYQLVARRWHWAAAAGAFALGFGQAMVSVRSLVEVTAVSALLLLGLLVWGLRSPIGQVIVPVVGALAAFMVGVRLWAAHIGFDNVGNVTWIHGSDLLLVVLMPLAVLLVLRAAGSAVSRTRFGQSRELT